MSRNDILIAFQNLKLTIKYREKLNVERSLLFIIHDGLGKKIANGSSSKLLLSSTSLSLDSALCLEAWQPIKEGSPPVTMEY